MQKSDVLLEIRNIQASYKEYPALNNVSLDIKKNTVLGLVGESGSGKSTLAKVITGPVSYTHLAVYKRQEQARLISELDNVYPIKIVEGTYDPQRFYEITKGIEQMDEGGERCFACYRLRLEEAAKLAADGGFDYVTTTLSIRPMKNAEKLNEIGAEVGEKYGIPWLFSDVKKKNGYKRSVELSKAVSYTHLM